MKELADAIEHDDLLHVDLGFELLSCDRKLCQSEAATGIPVVRILLKATHDAATDVGKERQAKIRAVSQPHHLLSVAESGSQVLLPVGLGISAQPMIFICYSSLCKLILLQLFACLLLVKVLQSLFFVRKLLKVAEEDLTYA